jgi:hypothetical protein
MVPPQRASADAEALIHKWQANRMNDLYWMNDLYRKMFDKYNDVFDKACQVLVDGSEQVDTQSPEFLNSVHNSIQNWTELPLEAKHPQVTGSSVINAIKSLEEAVLLAENAAAFCDDEIPDIVKVKLGSFGQAVPKAILISALDKDWEAEQAKVQDKAGGSLPRKYDAVISASFLRLLSEWQCLDCVGRILEKFLLLGEPSELVAESVRSFLASLDPAPVEAVVSRLDEAARQAEYKPAHEYLLIALTDIGKICPDDRIYRCLRESFRKMKNKAIGAICLGDYGDGRAVPVLRGWLDQNPDLADRQIFYEVISAIRRLGGTVD